MFTLFEFVFNLIRCFARLFEKPVMAYFNWRWRPKYAFEPKRGSNLQAVILPDERSFVAWPFLAGISKPGRLNPILTTLAFIILVAILGYAARPSLEYLFFPKGLPELGFILKPNPVLIMVMLLILLLAFIVMRYWYFEWWRRHTRLVVFTEEAFYLEAAPILLALIPGLHRGKDFRKKSRTPTRLIYETMSATDIEELGGPKTSWFQDKWSQYLTDKYDTGAMFFPSPVFGAADLFPPTEQSTGTIECIKKIGMQSVAYLRDLEYFENKTKEIVYSGVGDNDYDRAKSTLDAQNLWDQFHLLYPHPEERFDNLFDLDDPRIWNRKKGVKMEKSSEVTFKE